LYHGNNTSSANGEVHDVHVEYRVLLSMLKSIGNYENHSMNVDNFTSRYLSLFDGSSEPSGSIITDLIDQLMKEGQIWS
jgi:hypothetical protein